MFICICIYVCIRGCMCVCGCIYIYACVCVFFFFFLTTNLTDSFPPLSLEFADTRRSIWCSQDNAKPHENRRSNPWTYTPIKTHIHIIMNKSPLPTKPMHIFILQIHDQFHKNIHLPIQPKCDTQPLQSHTN